MISSGRFPPDQARSEVERYITLPRQATGYKIGRPKISCATKGKALLVRSSTFKAFDDLIITDGSQSLPLLERLVKQWIAPRPWVDAPIRLAQGPPGAGRGS
jgi:uncharacterized protein (DUF885 family)